MASESKVNTPVTIAIDAMSGDHGPAVVVPAALEAVRENEALSIVLVGIRSELEALLRDGHARIRVVEAADIVKMNERPSHALRHKRNSSMAIALGLVREGEGPLRHNFVGVTLKVGPDRDQINVEGASSLADIDFF